MVTNETNLIEIKHKVLDLLKTDLKQSEIEATINSIHNIFKEITQISGYDTKINHLITVNANKGKALSINHAAQCLLDYKRTTKLLRGLIQAIKDQQELHPNQKIHVFYAGCGPYAPYLTLIAPLFGTDEIEFSLLEINKESLEIAELLIENLELTDYVKSCYLKDATIFNFSTSENIHILFSETLDALLYRECYVPILWNLLPQLSGDTIVIPQNVQVNLSFKNDLKEIFEATVFDVRESINSGKGLEKIPNQFDSFKVDFLDKGCYDRIVLDTKVLIYKDHELTRNESSLTLALEMEVEKPIVHRSILFTYHTHPKIEMKLSLKK